MKMYCKRTREKEKNVTTVLHTLRDTIEFTNLRFHRIMTKMGREQFAQKRKWKAFEELKLEKTQQGQPLLALNPRTAQSTPGWKPPNKPDESPGFPYYLAASGCISKESRQESKDIRRGPRRGSGRWLRRGSGRWPRRGSSSESRRGQSRRTNGDK